MSFVHQRQLPAYLRDWQKRIEEYGQEYGLDFFPVNFEILSYKEMNEVAAYGGFPTRYPHWRFGMEYEQLSKSHEYGLSKIYEMVINNNPSVAYLLEGNSMVDQKLVMAHVLGHVDFFKNNFAFSITNQGKDPRNGAPVRKWVDTMANHGALVRRWSQRVGTDAIEAFTDSCLSLENLIDPQAPFLPKPGPAGPLPSLAEPPEELDEVRLLRVDKDYMSSFINPDEFVESQKKKIAEEKEKARKFPAHPRRDVLGFLLEHAPLEKWERAILDVVRREAYYFLPQMQTKIMNEGWASYWHSKLMTERICDGTEIIDYAERNAGVLSTAGGRLNPYKLGVELFRHVEARWNRGQFGREWEECNDYQERQNWDRRTGMGPKKIFDVRKLYTDVTFIDEFLTPDFVRENKMYAFGYNARNSRFEIETRQFQEVKSKLLSQLTNAGNPIITVLDANLENKGELLLEHQHLGVDLRLDWATEVLRALQRLWKRPVAIHTVVEEKPTRLRIDGDDFTRRSI